jgi:hypothetical protein
MRYGILQLTRYPTKPTTRYPTKPTKDTNLRVMKSTVQKRSEKGSKIPIQSHKTP